MPMSDNARMLSLSDAIREGLTEVAIRDPSVLLMAQGISDPSAVYGTTTGIDRHIERNRIIEMPVSENGMCGVAIGAALVGKRPVMSFHRVEFALLAMEQIINNAAKAHYISNGRHSVPIVIRLIVGRGWGQGPEHSQSLEMLFSHIPGLKVVMPVFPRDGKGLMIAAVEDNNPVLMIEHRWCHLVKGHVPEGYYAEPMDGPRLIHRGNDVTIVATSYMTLEALRAADALGKLDYSADVFDLRVLRPLNLGSILESVKRTGRLVTVDTGHRMFGIGAEITSEVVANCFEALKTAPLRIGLPDHPIPSSRGFVPGLYPDSTSILRDVGLMLGIDEAGLNTITAELVAQRNGIPVDVPDPFFSGPF